MTDKTREDFEAWVTKQGHAAGYGGDGVYDVWVVSRWWESWQAATQQSAARIEALEAEVLALRKDAERLDWSINNACITSEHWGGRWSIVFEGKAPDTLTVFATNPQAAVRSAIDAAIEAERGEG